MSGILLQSFSDLAKESSLSGNQLLYELRDTGSTELISILILLSITMIAISRLLNNQVFFTLTRLIFKFQNFEESLKETHRLGSVSSMLLLFNFGMAMFISAYLIFNEADQIFVGEVFLFSLLLPVFLIIWMTYGLLLAGFLSGKYNALRSPFQNTIVILQFSGILLAALNFIWYLNPEYYTICLRIFYAVLIGLIIYRLFKNVILGFANKISWYYIILYLCTLEILPIWLGYYYLNVNF